MDSIKQNKGNCVYSPATLGQKEVWLIQQLSPELPFNISEYAEINGNLNISVFETALRDIVAETPAMKSRFKAIDGELYQYVDNNLDINLHVIDKTDHLDESFDLDAWIQADITTLISPEDENLLNFSLICLPQNKFIYYQRCHHIIMDGRSLGLISKRISDRYDELISGKEPEAIIPDEPDLLAKKDIEYLQSKRFNMDKSYWDAFSQNANRLSFLSHSPNDRNILKKEQYIDESVNKAIEVIAENNNLRPTHIYIAAVAAHFYTLTGVNELSFSFPVTGIGKESKNLIGMTSNTLPLEVTISPTDNILDIARNMNKQLTKILKHQRYRGENILRKNKQEFSFGPAINLMLFDRGTPFRHCETKWIKAKGSQTHGFSVVFDDKGYGKGLSISFYGSDRLHSLEDIFDHHRRFSVILEQLAANPQNAIGQVDHQIMEARANSPRRTLFENIRNPLSAAVINWQVQDAQQIANLALALSEKAGVPPAVTKLKILINNRLFIVNQVESLPEKTLSAPGTLVRLDSINDGWQVTTLTTDIRISAFSTLDGTPVLATALAEQGNLTTGDRLPILSQQQSDALSAELAALATHEPFWLEKLQRFNPVDFPYSLDKTEGDSRLAIGEWQYSELSNSGDNSWSNIITLYAAYLHSLSGEQSFQLGYHAIRQGEDICSQLSSPWVPMDVTDIYDQSSLADVTENLNKEIKQINQAQSYATDIILRHEPLKRNTKLSQNKPLYALAVAITDGDILIHSKINPDNFPLLTLQINALNGQFRWIYNAAYLAENRITQINSHILQGLKNSVEIGSLSQPIGEINFIPKSEELLLLETLNHREYDFNNHSCIHRVFEQQVQKTPDAIAICHGERQLTYLEFDRLANRIAHHLVGLGIQADMRVALCMERSCLQIAALFGILKSGGCYVPLDPAYPSERLKDVLHDADPAVLLVDSLGQEILTGSSDVRTYDVDALLAVDTPDTPPQLPQLSVNQLAYVIFTSGSTGRPKGVMVEHAQVMNLYYALNEAIFHYYPKQSKVCLNSSISFDASLQSLLSLLSGHQLHIVPQDVRVDGARLVQFLKDNAIDVFDCTPTQLEMLLLSDLPNQMEKLILLIGGEALSPQTWRRLSAFNHFTAFNVYGPTECTVDATVALIDASHSLPTIGRPIANSAIYLLNNQLKPVPFGAVGQMYISGDGVTRGYLNQPALTEERYSADPFSAKNLRMYRTGDLARYFADGSLEYLGRDDQQVKINGYRIEPGEIEEKLLSHPQVNEAVVIAYKNASGEKQLVSYLVLAENPQTEDLPRHLRDFLSPILPEFMLPIAYVAVDHLPLTPNGKIDRKQLPAPDFSAYVHESYEAPQGDIEQELHEIWVDVLCQERIGRNDSFFAIGGDSLLAMKLLSKVQSRWQSKITMGAFFAQPTLAQLALLVAQAKPQTAAQIARIDANARIPLSFPQNRLWFIEQLGNNDENYNVPLLLKMNGELNAQRLQRCLNHLLDRHDALRSVFHAENGVGYVQLLPVGTEALLQEYDFATSSHANEDFWQLYQHEIAHKFDIAHGPLIRASLAHTAVSEHYLLLIIHHIVTDGWSMEILARELGVLYSAWSQGEPNPLPALPLQYPDYAQWQQQWLDSPEWHAHGQFWLQKLQGIPERMTLPSDRQRPAQQSFLGATVPIVLDQQLSDDLRRLSQKHHTTLFMTLMSAWSVVLSRLSGQQDLVIGTPVANRQAAECETLVGFFVNTLAMRINLAEAPTVAELLAQVRDFSLSAQEHQELPFDQVVELLQPQRSMDKTPLFQVMFAWENFDAVAPALTGMNVELIDPQVTRVKFDLELNLGTRQRSIVGSLNYATALFDRATIERHQQYLISVLRAMVRDDNLAVDRIQLLSDSEYNLLINQWNQTAEPYPLDVCAHQLFEQQAQRNPEAIALTYQQTCLTYAELNSLANHLANRLLAQGVKVEDKVAICSHRAPEMIIAMLATLKAGAAYLSIPPDTAPERQNFMLENAKPAAIVAQSEVQHRFSGCNIPLCLISDITQNYDGKSYSEIPNPTVAVSPENLAYVIYTSGSTGNPKGVMVEHGNLVQLVSPWCMRWDIGLGDNVLQFCNPTFDASVCEIFSALTSGANLVLRDDQWLSGTETFWQLCEHYNISRAILPYQFLRRLSEESDYPLPPSLRTLFFGGEAAAPEILQRWLSHYPVKPQLVNNYGPTETTVVATAHVPVLGETQLDSIGRPIANNRIYLLDPHGHPLPQGAIGELYIGGPGVARGYLNLPEMTAERFLPDPFSRVNGARMYRTGDLASYLPDGRIQFHGRNDHQVKIRGFRIELGEIETQLNSHPQLKEAAVLALDDGKGSKRLVAYVVADTEQPRPDIATLRNHLAALLPEYMVPAAYVLLDEMPITPNGKLDRKALPAPQEDAFIHRDFEAPQAGIETTLAEIWQELLGVEKVGRNDHFFELGGHSLLAVRVISQLQQLLNISIPLAALFDNPQLNKLAEVINREDQTGDSTLAGIIVPATRDKPLPLSFSQQRLWFLSQLSDSDSNYNVLMALALSGDVNIPILQQTLNVLYARHESLRSNFISSEQNEPVVILRESQSGIPLVEYDWQEQANSAEKVEEIYRQEERRIFDLAEDPLIQATWLRLRNNQSILLLTLHHIITDGWSMEILVRELGVIYSALLQQRTHPLPPLPIQYPDYAVWQQQWRNSPVWHEQGKFWQQLLTGAPERLTLPTDRPRPPQQSFIGASLPIILSSELSDELRRLSNRHGTSLFMTLLSAWSIVLSRLSGQDDLVIGTPVANRNQAECEDVIGFFVNTLALRINLSATSSVADLLAQVRKTTLDAQEHQALPFEQVVEILQPPRSMDKTPLFQVMFALENIDDIALNMAGLDVKLQEPPVSRVKFDLELSLGERNKIITGSLNYACALFDEATVQRHQHYLLAVLEAMVKNDAQLIGQIDLIADRERQLLLEQWNQTAQSYPTDLCIHHLFEQHAERNPDAIALVNNAYSLSYGELNNRANHLAYRLIEQGVKAEERVAICADRSPEMIVGILAILKAGGAYLSLPHDIAPERLKFMLEDAKPVAILAEPATLPLFKGCSVPHELLPAVSAPLQATWANPQPNLAPQNLAYVIYTSGSTGNPKGVLVEQGNLVQQMVTWCRQWNLGPQDKVLQFCNTTFDVSVSEIFSALTSGATLVLRDDQWLAGSTDFWQLCEQYGISYLDIPYQFWRKLCEESRGPLPDALRLICISGEAAAPEMLARWLKRYPDKPELVNCYGPTETTITATTHSPKLGISHIDSIGRPTANIRIYLLDNQGNLVPRGVIGEVYIGGPGVTRGYLNLPEMTAERFLPDPFSSVKGARMYRTGDLASYLADGRLQFHGRNDHQVKIRGFRIELGEIDTQLNDHPNISEAAVLALDDNKGSKRLVAYLVADASLPTPDPMALRHYLQSRLPDYMIPAAYVLLDSMPITPNGKLDRKALPAPQENAFLHQPYEAPLAGLETTIAEIWQSLLDREKVGRHDHFFELGGHSLLAVSAANRINAAIDDKVSVSDIFIAPTVKQLASRITQQARVSDVINLRQHALLPEDIQPQPQSISQGNDIFLTGATGFVGRFLLRELLDSTNSKIYCLVRGNNPQDSLQRLRNILTEWSLWRKGDEQRIITIQGDIKAPRLGIDNLLYQRLAQDVGVIFHSAVSMNHLESFEMAYKANVAGLVELLRLTTQGSRKILNFASTLNVFSPIGQQGHRVVNEQSSIQNEQHIADQGYVASKWVGEEIVNLAVARGIACNIFRLGLITADSELARYDELQAFYRLFKSSVQMGMAFDDVYGDIQLTPVDYTAKALAHLGSSYYPTDNIFHLSAMEGMSRREFIEQLNAHLPQPMTVVSHRQWLREAHRRYQQGEILPITPLIQDMMTSSDEELDHFYQSLLETTIDYDSSQTLKRLEQVEITLPTANSEWYRLFIHSLRK
ncbi:amino acid adenylation domain-containing protein [Yersinia nurmii]|uniref:Amino acid adenylation domain-containing protein n=1 Tax=Yersinia nurmii TaxID=685706 RepID=A0AAW7JY45_9GAMM|nr:non-ribosomal peptide synthetase [Yersinia nurmii]MDN0087529.1 amino acid adenylation domain-containing protein [Yersinia nurmii]